MSYPPRATPLYDAPWPDDGYDEPTQQLSMPVPGAWQTMHETMYPPPLPVRSPPPVAPMTQSTAWPPLQPAPAPVPAPAPAPAGPAQPAVTYHGRPLPSLCVPFTSPHSQALLQQAMQDGLARIYFPLAGQYLTQSEPAFCGLATLCMILNAANIDPRQTWKGVWRWYTETMLSCCRPLATIEKQGITMAEFLCLARCNGLDAWARSVDAQQGLTIQELERDMMASCRSEDLFMALSYGRKALGQTGEGHFSPLAAYCRDADGQAWCLVLDVARFKYCSYWVTLESLFEAICTKDPETGRARGYCLLSKSTGASNSCQAVDFREPAIVHISLDKNQARQLFSIPGLAASRTVRELKGKAADLKAFSGCISLVPLEAYKQHPEAAERVEEQQRQLRNSGWSMQDLFYAGLVEHLNSRVGRYVLVYDSM
ncbi:Phytochelatin synthase-domain-containing protein [Protomyces lactucae-debilis]|uniref:glutathione gamma-glutamylcysteinyltransferase n=1 Tax=Protomyces lactucae-debilis TaxID=2754530 RepID=A0A1Y2F0B1_PROLT|nr:Phytochelatin synthase-domain-containing protein [Protomyces lactucae-debilis]ORY77322.1 Phytochelatin synthase-domain-containing protein [Protomyces lactucae-debilis]